MKRLGSILCLAALIVTMTVGTCFGAQSLKIVDTYPVDGQKNTTKENLCVKLTFNGDVGDKAVKKANSECFKISGPDGTIIPIKVYFDPEHSEKVMVLADTTKKLEIKDDTEYTLTVSKDFADKDGNTLGEDNKITFTTMNQARGTTVYMVMMFLMFGGMFAFSAYQAKKQREKDFEAKVKELPFNPYKEAKRTGKSVEEIIAAHERAMEKKKAKEAKRAKKAEAEDYEDEEEEEIVNGNYKVKGPRPISAGGSSYITGRKAQAEARKAEEERLARRRAANKKKKKK
ncbi:MAG: Ig-like domain-containing protein [Eubacteriaceae bacterium]|nr:Ig-like domain-containing protein [Eubacteriaceae bacterium]